ncbi:MAG: hypothetical protein SWK76_09550 [Actinomycetota bacterium]|nr:hypothetical protein [Actinomycetota bacterium]
MPQANWILVLHFLALWGSVATSLMAGWLLPLSNWISLPLGMAVWLAGFTYNLYSMKRYKNEPSQQRSTIARRGYHRITARTIMNLGVAVLFRSWFTLIIAVILVPFYMVALRRRQQYLDYLRTGMMSDAFPERTRRH